MKISAIAIILPCLVLAAPSPRQADLNRRAYGAFNGTFK